jgi:hypothetical protein
LRISPGWPVPRDDVPDRVAASVRGLYLLETMPGGGANHLVPASIPIELHLNITALSLYNISNQFTFAHNFGVDMSSAQAVERRAWQVADIILAWVPKAD